MFGTACTIKVTKVMTGFEGSGGQGGTGRGREEGGADYRAVVGLYDGVIGAGVGT